MTECASLSKDVQAEGNKNPPLASCSYQCKNWVMTWNNYPDNVFEILQNTLIPKCVHYVFGKEVGDEGTPHIQGAFILKGKTRKDTLFRLLGHNMYLEKMNGKWTDQNYCTKAHDYIADKPIPKKKQEYRRMTYDMLRDNQKEIVDLFKEPEDPLFGRKIYWFWEQEGCWGKTIICKYFVDNTCCLIVEGKNQDVKYGVAEYVKKNRFGPEIIVLDVPRINKDHVSFQAIESVKNGIFFSPKYESGMCRYDCPHVIVFSNEPPSDLSVLSADRWVIKELTGM